VQAVISAWQSAREVDALAASAALAYAYTGRADEADRILGAMVRTAGDPSTAEWATQWQQRLEAGVTRGDILAEMRRDAAADAPFKEWTLHHPSVMRKVKLARGLEAAQYFINEQRQQQERDRAAQPSNNQGGDTQRR
jgi:hypothetical protein